jgi:hypothetical protein
MSEDDSYDYERYTEKDLYRDLEVLRKAGIIQIEGISDDGQWLYGMTQEGRDLMAGTVGMNYDALARVFENIERIDEEGE